MKTERKKPIQILFLFISISFMSSSILFLSFFELSFAQRDVNENNINTIKKYSHNDWKCIKDKIIFITNSENTKPLNKNVNDTTYIDFNHFRLLHMIPDVKVNKYELSLFGDTIIPITLYPNMTSLEDARVYQNMSSLGQDRVYQNMTSLEDARVYQNMTSLEDARVYHNMSSLAPGFIFQVKLCKNIIEPANIRARRIVTGFGHNFGSGNSMMRMSMNLELLSLCSSFDWYSLKLTNLRPGMGFESLTAVHGIIVNYG